MLRVLKFSGNNCPACNVYEPEFERAVGETSINAEYIRLENAPTMFEEYKVTKIPTTILLKDGKEVARVVGIMQYEPLRDLIGTHNR